MARDRDKELTDKEVLEDLRLTVVEDRRNDQVIVIIPSHDRNQKKLNNQEPFASAGLDLFGRIYGGATAFTALRGVFLSEDRKTLLYDEPIMIQSLARREDAEDPDKLQELLSFAKRLCKETNQESVAVICNGAIRFIKAH